eukprot:5490927-Alexandrium_andersonii.AAC.1
MLSTPEDFGCRRCPTRAVRSTTSCLPISEGQFSHLPARTVGPNSNHGVLQPLARRWLDVTCVGLGWGLGVLPGGQGRHLPSHPVHGVVAEEEFRALNI